MRKVDVETYPQGGYGPPAINVKGPHVAADVIWRNRRQVEDGLQCSEGEAERMLIDACNQCREDFWCVWELVAPDYFPTEQDIEVDCVGRSGGWLVVHGLKPVEHWNALDVARWGRFVKAVKADLRSRCERLAEDYILLPEDEDGAPTLPYEEEREDAVLGTR